MSPATKSDERFAWMPGDLVEVAAKGLKYSPDQARDDHGRWTADGGTQINTDGLGGDKNRQNLDASEVKARLLAIHQRNEQAAQDAKWYENQHALIGETAAKLGVDPTVLAGVVAATSPQMAWETANGKMPNMLAAAQVMQYAADNPGVNPDEFAQSLEHPGMLRNSLSNGMAIAQGQAPADVLTAPKTASFYNNLAFPGQTDSVTVDAWMARAIAGTTTSVDYNSAPSAIIGSNGYGWAADTIRSAAADAGVSPDAFQASVWSQYRREL